MPKGPVRRAQLIAPFGVGAMLVTRDGTSVISAGLDHWFKREGEQLMPEKIRYEEFIINEWRLQRVLNVDHFMLPPDYRTRPRGEDIPNCNITVPFLRFPQWHFCPSCNLLKKLPLSLRGKELCPECEEKGINRTLVQVPFIAMCDRGHIQDFPWREWVHGTPFPSCHRPLRLIATGGASLSAQKVKCDCGATRNLGGIVEAKPDGSESYLSSNLYNRGNPFLCQGKRPWHGTEEGETCDRPIRGSLRSASNVYFAEVRSALYLPRAEKDAPSELIALLEKPPLVTLINLLKGAGVIIKAEQLRNQHSLLLESYLDDQIEVAVKIVSKEMDESQDNRNEEESNITEMRFRLDEYDALRLQRDEQDLLINDGNISSYDGSIPFFFERLMLVKKMKETRVLVGFSRVFPGSDLDREQKKNLLWAKKPTGRDLWLPAYIVFGEGIFIEFKENILREWENLKIVRDRVEPLVKRYSDFQLPRRLRDRPLSPRFVMIHTFAHILINQLTFECGYSSAALRERLYVSDDPINPMTGVLIYTAAGDAEGTMGGLVKMGEKSNFEAVFNKAIDRAKWCSADPVCMELGDRGGQGPDSCNLSACHNCSLIPETACEEFNRFLDRALLIGDLNNSELGFFRRV
jgi:hypothetical protein